MKAKTLFLTLLICFSCVPKRSLYIVNDTSEKIRIDYQQTTIPIVYNVDKDKVMTPHESYGINHSIVLNEKESFRIGSSRVLSSLFTSSSKLENTFPFVFYIYYDSIKIVKKTDSILIKNPKMLIRILKNDSGNPVFLKGDRSGRYLYVIR